MLYCEQPDRDVPGLQCGCSLPCRFHTAVIDTTCDPPTVKVPITSKPAQDQQLLVALKDIGRAMIEERELES